MRLELIRHGETALQKERRYQGITDAPLSSEGRETLRPAKFQPERVIVTPLQRTRETAEILFPGVPQLVIPGLQEMNFGRFEGKNYRGNGARPGLSGLGGRDVSGELPRRRIQGGICPTGGIGVFRADGAGAGGTGGRTA